MNAKRTCFLLTLFFLFAAQLSYSKGIFGSYVVSGKAYDSKGNLLKNQVISVYDGKQTQEIKSDENGNYSVGVLYGTACRSVKRGGSFRKADRQMNTRRLVFSYHKEKEEIQTNWKKGARSGVIRRTLKFK